MGPKAGDEKAQLIRYLKFERKIEIKAAKGRVVTTAGMRLASGPVMLFHAADALFPQYDRHTDGFVAAYERWLKETAELLLEENKYMRSVAPHVAARWRSVANGSFFRNLSRKSKRMK